MVENNNFIDNQSVSDDNDMKNKIKSNLNLTNEQKLEYLRNLIQDTERNLESDELTKKLVRQQK